MSLNKKAPSELTPGAIPKQLITKTYENYFNAFRSDLTPPDLILR